jgi:hypothetical protein
MASQRSLAAIYGDDLAGDERGLRGGGEYDGVGDLFRDAGAFQRHARDQPGLPVSIAREAIAPSSAADLVSPSTACLLAA